MLQINIAKLVVRVKQQQKREATGKFNLTKVLLQSQIQRTSTTSSNFIIWILKKERKVQNEIEVKLN